MERLMNNKSEEVAKIVIDNETSCQKPINNGSGSDVVGSGVNSTVPRPVNSSYAPTGQIFNWKMHNNKPPFTIFSIPDNVARGAANKSTNNGMNVINHATHPSTSGPAEFEVGAPLHPRVSAMPRSYPPVGFGGINSHLVYMGGQHQNLPSYLNGCTTIQKFPHLEHTTPGHSSIPPPPPPPPPVPPSHNYISLLSEHNYAKLPDPSAVANNCGDELRGFKRSLNDLNRENESMNVGDSISNTPTKKKKTAASNRENLMIPLTHGFVREVIKVEVDGQESKKSVIYKSPNGVVLNKKPDVKNYLSIYKNVELKPEWFSFDSRLNLTPKKAKDVDNGSKKSTNQDNSTTNNDHSVKKSKDNATSGGLFGKRTLSSRLKKLISKYWKKEKEDSRFLDGIHSGSYRRKIPPLPTPLINISIKNNSLESMQQIINNTYGDCLCTFEFLNNFSSRLITGLKNSSTTTGASEFSIPHSCSMYEILESLHIEKLNDSLYVKLFGCLLRFAVICDNFRSEVNSLYFMDNVYSLPWNWLLINEIFRLYLHSKSKYVSDHCFEFANDNMMYMRNLNELNTDLSEGKCIYGLSGWLKMFALRFLVDQITSTSTFATWVNDVVENVCKNRRDKYYLDSQIRLLKGKMASSGNAAKLNTSIEADKNGVSNPDDSNQSSIPDFTNSLKEYENKREQLKIDVKIFNSTLRTLFLGFDRFSRMYQYSSNSNIVLVEGTSKFMSLIEDKIGVNRLVHSKPNIVDTNPTIQQHIGILSSTLEKHQSLDITNVLNESTFVKTPIENIQLMGMLFSSPKIIKTVTEDEIEYFVEVYTQTGIKQRKKPFVSEETIEGWWNLYESSKITQICKTLNQRGIREHYLLKSFTKYQDVISEMKEYTSDSNEESSSSSWTKSIILYGKNTRSTSAADDNTGDGLSCFDIDKMSNQLILDEIVEISHKMDKYLVKIGVEAETSIFEFGQQLMKEINVNEVKKILSQMIVYFCQNCERKFDRPWLSKWNESFETYTSLPTIYLYCLSLKLKLDPNCKVCKLCQKSNDTLNISECHVCSTVAHDVCLTEPMKRCKKTKLICATCHKETLSKTTKVCRGCNIKSGKTIVCSICKEHYHSKCMGLKAKKGKDCVVCDACLVSEKINNPKLYTRPTISFVNAPFKLYNTECSNILKTLKENKDSTPFQLPVDEQSVPTYHQIVKKPMDFSTIDTKINSNKYKNVTQFYNDVIQIFENCHIFNEDNSKIAKCGVRLQKYFEKEWCRISSTFTLQ